MKKIAKEVWVKLNQRVKEDLNQARTVKANSLIGFNNLNLNINTKRSRVDHFMKKLIKNIFVTKIITVINFSIKNLKVLVIDISKVFRKQRKNFQVKVLVGVLMNTTINIVFFWNSRAKIFEVENRLKLNFLTNNRGGIKMKIFVLIVMKANAENTI